MSTVFAARPSSVSSRQPEVARTTTAPVATLASIASTNDDHHAPPASHVAHPSQPVLFLPPLLPPLPSSVASSSSTSSPPPLDPASLSLHKSLHSFRPFHDYARLPYEAAFNWSSLFLDEDLEREWYCVVFRSKRNDKLDNDFDLYEADRKAHEEAIRNGGLLM